MNGFQLLRREGPILVSTRRTHLDAVDVAVLNCSYEGSGCQR